MYESTDGWLCVSNMADRAAGIKQRPQVKLSENDYDNNTMNLCLCLTSGSPRVRIPRALAHAGEELVDLF